MHPFFSSRRRRDCLATCHKKSLKSRAERVRLVFFSILVADPEATPSAGGFTSLQPAGGHKFTGLFWALFLFSVFPLRMCGI